MTVHCMCAFSRYVLFQNLCTFLLSPGDRHDLPLLLLRVFVTSFSKNLIQHFYSNPGYTAYVFSDVTISGTLWNSDITNDLCYHNYSIEFNVSIIVFHFPRNSSAITSATTIILFCVKYKTPSFVCTSL
jgi:hypothetical protein